MIEGMRLNTGALIPAMGLGTSYVRAEETVESIKNALSIGYRLIDTATMYGNEAPIGQGIRESGVPRDDIFLSTKLWPDDFNDPEAALEASLQRLGSAYVDMYLIHWPRGMQPHVWKALEGFARDGRARNIGVCNFSIEEIEALLSYCEIEPAVNQIPFNPFSFDPLLKEYCEAGGSVLAFGEVPRKIDGEDILRRVDHEGVTLLCCAPAVIAMTLDIVIAR